MVVSGSRYIASDAVELGGGDLWCRALLPRSLATLTAAAPAPGRAGFAARRTPSPAPPLPPERRRHRRKHE